jgi:hypothetical protein
VIDLLKKVLMTLIIVAGIVAIFAMVGLVFLFH